MFFKYLLISQIHLLEFPNCNPFCAYSTFYTHSDIFHYSIFDFELHVVLLNLHLQSHEICFIIVLALYILFIILRTLTFTSFVSLGTHSFVDQSSIALQLLLHLSRITMNGE